MNYYEKELQGIDPKSLKDFTPAIKVFAMNGQSTKYMSLNKESANALIEWLQKNFTMKSYTITDTEAGNVLDTFDTLDEATATLIDYENQDKHEGIFVTDFYQIKQNNILNQKGNTILKTY